MAWDHEAEPLQERYRQMLMRHGEASGYAHGWKADAAKALGVRPEFVSRVLTRTRRVSRAELERVGLLRPPADHRAELQALLLAMWDGDDKVRLLALRRAARALVDGGSADPVVVRIAGMVDP